MSNATFRRGSAIQIPHAADGPRKPTDRKGIDGRCPGAIDRWPYGEDPIREVHRSHADHPGLSQRLLG
jgi:hypothetical protein